MDKSTEYLINVTAVYCNGRKDSILIRHRDYNAEAACNAVSDLFKNYGKKPGVEYLTTTLVGPAPTSTKSS